MSFMDKISRTFGSNKDVDDEPEGYGTEEDDESDEDADDHSNANIPPRNPLGGGNVVDFTSVASLREQQARAKQQQAEAAAAHNAAQAAAQQQQQQPMKVVVIEPKSFDDSQQVSQCLMDRRPVVINFENTDTDVAHRIVDFISGTVYALDGDIRKISRNVFLCAPSNVKLSSGDEMGGLGDMTWLTK